MPGADKPTKLENGVFVRVKKGELSGKQGSIGDVRQEDGVEKFLVRIHDAEARRIDEHWLGADELVAIPQPGTEKKQ